MHANTCPRILRLVLLAAMGWALASAAQQAPARTPAPKGSNANAQLPASLQSRLRGTTNAQRRAAAARTAERKLAAGQKNQVVQPGSRGVKK